MMQKKIRLQVYGITANQVQAGAYALLLEAVDTDFRIPVIIGAAEAQSIAMQIENVKSQRPLTHDLFASFAHAFGIHIFEVNIYKFVDGVFYSDIRCTDGDREITIDARTSDAIALALRTNAQIYTTPEVIRQAGFVYENEKLKPAHIDDHIADDQADDTPVADEVNLERYTIEELQRMMLTASEREDYERAAKIRNIIAQKR